MSGIQPIAAARRRLVEDRQRLPAADLATLAALPDATVPSLAALAHEVRLAWCGPTVEVEGILSAKTGGCPEDCHFCAQSSRFDTPVQATPFLDTDEVLAAARETAALGASEFCIVLAVRGPRRAHHAPAPRSWSRSCGTRPGSTWRCRPGSSSRDQARAPRRRRRAPLQPQPGDGPVLLPARSSPPTAGRSGTDTCRAGDGRRHGAVLRGAARDGRDRRPAPRADRRAGRTWRRPRCPSTSSTPGRAPRSPIRRPVAPLDAIRWIALFRLGLPDVILRYAGGREITLGELQAMGMTAGINALIVGNYLTTLGRPPRRGPGDARRPPHADRRPRPRPLTMPGHCTGCGRAGRPTARRRAAARRPTSRPATARPAAAASGPGHPGRLDGHLPGPRRGARPRALRRLALPRAARPPGRPPRSARPWSAPGARRGPGRRSGRPAG